MLKDRDRWKLNQHMIFHNLDGSHFLNGTTTILKVSMTKKNNSHKDVFAIFLVLNLLKRILKVITRFRTYFYSWK